MSEGHLGCRRGGEGGRLGTRKSCQKYTISGSGVNFTQNLRVVYRHAAHLSEEIEQMKMVLSSSPGLPRVYLPVVKLVLISILF